MRLVSYIASTEELEMFRAKGTLHFIKVVLNPRYILETSGELTQGTVI